MSAIAESHVEEAALAWLEELGYGVANGLVITSRDKLTKASQNSL